VETFCRDMAAAYEARTGVRIAPVICRIVDGAS